MTSQPVNRPTIPKLSVGTSLASFHQMDSYRLAENALSVSAVGGDPEAVRTSVSAGSTKPMEDAKKVVSNPTSTIVEEALDPSNGVTAEQLEESFNSADEKTRIFNELEDFLVENKRLVEGMEHTPTDIRYATNLWIAEQVFLDRMGKVEKETGALGYMRDWTDRFVFRQIPIGVFEDLTRRSERKGKDIMQAALTMDPKEFRAYIEKYADEVGEEGFFSSDNWYAYAAALEEATNAGYDPTASFNQLMSILELAPVAGKAIKMSAGMARASSALTKADSVVGRVAAIEGAEAAAETGKAIIRSSDSIDNRIATKMGPSAYDDGPTTVRPQSAKLLEIYEENELSRIVNKIEESGAFGRYSPEAVAAKLDNVVSSYKARTTNIIYNYLPVKDITGNQVARVLLGNTRKGTPYVRKADADKALTRMNIPEGEVVPVDPEDGSKGFVIKIDKRMDMTDIADPIDINATEYGFVRETLARVFGSNAALDDEYLSALSNMAEASESLLREEAKSIEVKLASVPMESKKAIVRVYKDLRDGKDADIKRGYTVEEFKEKFREFHPTGKSATQKDVDAYVAAATFEDAAWLMRANEVLTRYVKKDYWALDIPSGRVVGRKVSSLDGETKVFNAKTGAVEKVSEIDDRVPVWRLDAPMEDGTEFITNPTKVSILDHADVMGFNSGGRRINIKANYFVVFTGDNPRAFLTAFSEKQARKAVDEFNNIRNGILARGDDITAIKGDAELDDLIRANNDWNPSITTFDEFAELVKEKKWDISKEVSYKQRNGQINSEDKVAPVFLGDSWENHTRRQLHRYNDVLMDYGGGTAYNVDPINAILEEFQSASSHYLHKHYTYNAAAAWVKRAQQAGSNVRLSPLYAQDDYLNQMQHAEILGTNEAANKLRHLRGVIRRRLKMKGPVEQRFASYGQEAAEYIFDKTGLKLNVKDPSNALLGFGFQSAFGFFNVSQFFMQGMHAVTIMSISPKHGLKGAGLTPALRGAINAPTAEARKLAIQRVAKFSGETEETLNELVEYIRTSGRDIIDGDVMELGTGPSYGVSGWNTESYLPSVLRDTMSKATVGGRRLLDAGLIPFRAGERLGRMTGVNTAFFEFKAKYPNVSALSDEGRRWITNREQQLTFNMTSSGRAYFQSGLMKVPTQWLSYSFRAMEAMVLGRGFSAAERARMAAMLIPFYGLTGMGLGSAADWATETFGITDPGVFIAMKYGFLDWFISETTPVETALATRLAPVTAFTDMYSKVTGEASFLEVLAGPSGSIASNTFQALWKTLGNLRDGHNVSLTEDAIQILRQPSGLDNIAKGTGIMVHGMYTSKTGTTLPIEMKPSDALISLLGFSPLEVSEFYSRKSGKFNSDKKFRKFSKRIYKDWERALREYSNDPEKGKALMEEINVKIALSGFSLDQQMGIRQNLFSQRQSELYRLSTDLIRKDKNLSAQMLEKLLGGEN